MDVPDLVLATLQHTKLRQSSAHSPFAQQAMTILQVSQASVEVLLSELFLRRLQPAQLHTVWLNLMLLSMWL